MDGAPASAKIRLLEDTLYGGAEQNGAKGAVVQTDWMEAVSLRSLGKAVIVEQLADDVKPGPVVAALKDEDKPAAEKPTPPKGPGPISGGP